MVQLQDEPIADPVCVPTYYVSKLARDHGVIVAQVGEGSDELFCGYDWWRRSLFVQRLDDLPVPRAAKRIGLAAFRSLGETDTLRYEWLRRGSLGQPTFWGGAEGFGQSVKERLLSPRLRGSLSDLTSWDAIEPIRRRFLEKAWEPSSLNWMTYLDLSLRLPELILMRVDKMSMGASIECRVPFLDQEVVALALSIPTRVKLRDHTTKSILKRAVRGVIPDAMIDRPKQGFSVPVQAWYQDRLGQTAKRDVAELCAATDLFDPTQVHSVMASGNAERTWFLHNLALWWREYIA
jgi:asparagine synthase (glutamine-hydrolysing)